nr:DUF4269 domain-containing protein [uncultured Flavobacterium sp.]
MIDFSTIDYLKDGNFKQQKAFEVLTQHQVLVLLSNFDPLLVGTIPINIDTDNSDLDIICCYKSKTDFITQLQDNFSTKSHYTIREALIDNIESVIANFSIANFQIEIFGQNIPVKKQNGYRHMIIEHEILKKKGDNFRLEIIKLKQQGYKTEPAFGKLLELKGNPYQALLEYKI